MGWITIIWMLESDSTHWAFHQQLTQYHNVIESLWGLYTAPKWDRKLVRWRSKAREKLTQYHNVIENLLGVNTVPQCDRQLVRCLHSTTMWSETCEEFTQYHNVIESLWGVNTVPQCDQKLVREKAGYRPRHSSPSSCNESVSKSEEHLLWFNPKVADRNRQTLPPHTHKHTHFFS